LLIQPGSKEDKVQQSRQDLGLKDARTHVTVLKDVVGYLDIGIGWNSSGCLNSRWPEFLVLGNDGTGRWLKRKFSTEDWDRYFGLMAWSGCHWLRHSISISDWASWEDISFKTNRRVFNFASKRMQRHYTVLDQADKHGIKVLLTNWNLGTEMLANFWTTQENSRSKEHPENEDAFAESLAMIVYHLKLEKKYKCVWALSLWNEPNGEWAYTGPKANYPESFWPLYELVDKHLRRLGVRDEILLFGPDTSTGGHPHHITKMLEKHGPILDIIGDHDYSAFRGKSMVRSLTAYDHFMHDVNNLYGRRVPFVISEFGNYGMGSGAVDNDKQVYNGALSTIAYLIRMINRGTAGLARWEFLIYGSKWRNFGALTSMDQDYVFRPYGPIFYPHAITARYIKPGWHVCKVQVEPVGDFLSTTTLTSPQGDITILLLNDDVNPASLHIRLDLQVLPDRLHHLLVTGPLPEGIQQEKDLVHDNGELKITLPPKSIAALTSLHPGKLDEPEMLALERSTRDELYVRLFKMRNRISYLRGFLRRE